MNLGITYFNSNTNQKVTCTHIHHSFNISTKNNHSIPECGYLSAAHGRQFYWIELNLNKTRRIQSHENLDRKSYRQIRRNADPRMQKISWIVSAVWISRTSFEISQIQVTQFPRELSQSIKAREPKNILKKNSNHIPSKSTPSKTYRSRLEHAPLSTRSGWAPEGKSAQKKEVQLIFKSRYSRTLATLLCHLAFYYPTNSVQVIILTENLNNNENSNHWMKNPHFYIKTYRKAALYGMAGWKPQISIGSTSAVFIE